MTKIGVGVVAFVTTETVVGESVVVIKKLLQMQVAMLFCILQFVLHDCSTKKTLFFVVCMSFRCSIPQKNCFMCFMQFMEFVCKIQQTGIFGH